MKRLLLSALMTLAAGACAELKPAQPPAPVAAAPAAENRWRAATITATTTTLKAPLYESGNGPVVFAGGLTLTSDDPALRGLSDLKLTNDGRLFLVSDQGALIQAKLALDENRRLTGLNDVFVRPLVGLEGQPLADAAAQDAESLAILPDGRLLVGFERQHRLWVYDAKGEAPQWAPNPMRDLPEQAGLKALSVAAQPEKAPKGRFDYLLGAAGGQVSRCAFANFCARAVLKGEEDPAFALTALDVFDRENDAYVAVYRAHDAVRGLRIRVKVLRSPFARTGDLQVEPLLELNAGNTVGDIEGVAADAARPDGSRRLYLLSDNGGEAGAGTLLLAFDVS